MVGAYIGAEWLRYAARHAAHQLQPMCSVVPAHGANHCSIIIRHTILLYCMPHWVRTRIMHVVFWSAACKLPRPNGSHCGTPCFSHFTCLLRSSILACVHLACPAAVQPTCVNLALLYVWCRGGTCVECQHRGDACLASVLLCLHCCCTS